MNRRLILKAAFTALAARGARAFDGPVANAGFLSGAGEAIPGWTKPTYAERRAGQPPVPEGMVYIPAGSYVMGSPAGEVSRPHLSGEGGPPGRGSREDTRHNVRLSAFCISKFLITNAQYKLFCDSAGSSQYRPGGRRSGVGCYWDHPLFDWNRKANHPVLWVGYNQAIAYCKWVSHNTGWDVVLPSESQWERAARGATRAGLEFDFPWGNETSADDYKKRLTFNVTCAMDNGIAKTVNGTIYPHWPFVVETRGSASMASNFKGVVYGEDERTRDIAESSEEVKAVWKRIMDAGGHTTPVGTYPPGPDGCFDMAGNAFEWTRDFYTISSYIALAERRVDPCVDDVSMLTDDDRKSGSDGTMGSGPESSNGRPTQIIRGGSWYANEGSCRTHRRTETRAPGQGGFHSVGFRVVAEVSR